jgi:hypothetical protein
MAWENDYEQGYNQLLPRSRGAKSPMNHPVTQQSVLNYLPAVGTGNYWAQVRIHGYGDHTRMFIEANVGGPVNGGEAAVAKGISHDSERRAGRTWVYRRISKRNWSYYSGDTQPY